MKLRQIEVFHAVYSTGSVSRAAELLHVSQPSVSKVLRHTEDVLGFLLFERTGGKLIPTREARKLYPSAVQIQSDIDQLNQRVMQITRDTVESLSIAMTPGIGLSFGPEAMAKFHQEMPNIILDAKTLHYQATIDGLLNKSIDIGIVYEPYPHPDISRIALSKAELVCLSATHNLKSTSEEKIRFSDLAEQQIISLNTNDPLGKLLQSQLEKSNCNTDSGITANTYYIAKKLAAEHAGVAIVDEFTAKSTPLDGLELIRFQDPLVFSVMALVPEDSLRSRVESRFLEIITGILETV